MSWEKSETITEYFKIITAADKVEPNPYQEDLSVIEEKTLGEPEKSIIEEAHKDPVYIAESRGDGALVENQIEQHDKMMHVVNKMPTGNLTGRYASAIQQLVKMANMCDEMGDTKSADIITDVARKMVDNLVAEPIPFVKAPTKG